MTSLTGMKTASKREPATPRRAHAGISRGFTFIELLIVATVIIALALVSIPRFRRTYQDIEWRDGLFTLVKNLTHVRQQAIMEEITYKVVFNCSDSSYAVIPVKAPSGEGDTYSEENKEGFQASHTYDLPGHMKCKGEDTEVLYYPSGRTSGLSLTLSDGGSRSSELTVHPRTGEVALDHAEER